MDIFTIAVVRGHFELARGILQDVDAQQWKRDTKKSTRKVYEVVVDNDNDYNSYDSDSEPDAPDSEGVNVRFDIVDDEQTIDDVRELEAVSVGKYTTSVSHLLNRERDMSMFLGDENKDTVKADHATLADTHLLNWYRDPIVSKPSPA